MQKVSASELIAPGVCHLCTAAPSEGQSFVDTLKTFVTGFPTGKEGRIYVCESCGRAVGEALNLEAGDKVASAQASEALAKAELASLRDHISALAKSLEAGSLDFAQSQSPAVLRVAADAAAAVEEKPAPKKKAAAKTDEA